MATLIFDSQKIGKSHARNTSVCTEDREQRMRDMTTMEHETVNGKFPRQRLLRARSPEARVTL
jgi:hypothetical protein